MRYVVAALCCVLLASCQTSEEQGAQADAMCTSMARQSGANVDQQANIYSQCMMQQMQIAENRSARRSAALSNFGGTILAQQNQPVYGPVTTNCTRYGRNLTCTSY